MEINYVNFLNNKIEIGWSKQGIGFGILTIHSSNQGFEIETECMGEKFYYEVLEKFNEYLKQNFQIIE